MRDIDRQVSALSIVILSATAKVVHRDVDIDILTDIFILNLGTSAAAEKNGVTYKYVSRLVSKAYHIPITNLEATK